MLGPEYLAALPDAVCSLWQQAEDDILKDIARHIRKADGLTNTAEYQAWRLEAMRTVQGDIIALLAKYSGRTRAGIRKLLIDAGTHTLEGDDAIHRAAGKEPTPVNGSPTLLNLLNAGFAQTLGTWQNLTATTASTVSGEFERRMDQAWLQISSGAFDYRTAVQRAVDDLADSMMYITYPSGHRDTLEVAVRRCVLTGVNQTAGKLQMTRMTEMGCEYVEVTAHAGARPEHAAWQGKVYHIGGESVLDGIKYADFKDATGYGTGAGLCGWNCRHNFYPFYPKISVRNYTSERLQELDAKDIEYCGKKYTRYEISQMRRALERKVRKYKRRCLVEEAAGADTEQSTARLSNARRELAVFVRQTGGKVDESRTRVAGVGQSTAGKATRTVKRAYEGPQGFQHSLYLKVQPVTMESISSVKAFRCRNLDKSGQERLKSRHKQLLMTARKLTPGTEAAQVFDLNMNPLTQQIIGKEAGNSVNIPDQNVPYVAIHTHPDCGIFSPRDLLKFVTRENMQMLTAIGHNGHIYAVEKMASYKPDVCVKIAIACNEKTEALKEKPISELSNEQFVEEVNDLVNKAIEEVQKHGIAFHS